MSWHKITLEPEQISAGAMEIIRNHFDTLFLDAAGPQEMALFCDAREQANGGEEGRQISMYFSPGSLQYASELIGHYSCTPCEKPTAGSLELLVGHSDAWALLK